MKEEIKKIFKGDVEDEMETLQKYSHDASIFEVVPKVVVFPKDSTDVKNLVKWVNEQNTRQDLVQKISITARCAGTDMSGGSIGESIIMDFTRYMNKLVGGPLPIDNPSHPTGGTFRHQNYPSVPSSITVEPGMFYRDFEKITLAKGLILPSYTASKSINAVGGMFGNNSAGEKTLKYGQTENYVVSSKVVFADGNEYEVVPLSKEELNKKINKNDFEGNVYKNIYELIQQNYEDIKHAKPNVHKNSSGYFLWNVLNPDSEKEYFNLNKLLVGSQGTLGIATEITFKVLPIQKKSKLVVVFINNLEPLGRLVDEILTMHPETLETYDDQTMKLAVRFFPDFLKNKGVKGMFKFMWSFLPEAMMILSQF
jgi:FAD/FMN-containing dehydrogenase